MSPLQSISGYFTGADPGLVVGGGTNPLGEGAPTQYIYTFSEKPHEIKEILVRRGACAKSAPLNLPLLQLAQHILTASKLMYSPPSPHRPWTLTGWGTLPC